MQFQFPGLLSLVYLAYVLLFLPLAAFRGARAVAAARARGEALPASRERIWIGTTVSLVMLFGLSWYVGSTFDHRLFTAPTFDLRTLGLAAGALATCFVLRALGRALHSPAARRGLTVRALAPRTPRESAWSFAAIVVAAVAEEAAYRGVAHAILWWSSGSWWTATILCAWAFAASHAVQGFKSSVLIFLLALTLHGLVLATGTLVWAMVVHLVYDLVAAWWIRRDALADDAAAVPA